MPRRLGRNLRHRQTQIAQSIGAILATADFRAPLRTSLVPTRGTGAPSFTRATTGTVVDHEGVIRTCLAGEARLTGARLVRNLWGIQSATLAVAASNTMTLPAGSYIFSMGAGAGTATFSGTGGATGTLAAGTGRASVLKVISAGTLIVTCSIATLIDLQVEDVTAQSIQTAGEYVSVGVLPFPYHGTGVDGSRCFDTTLSGVPIPRATLKGYLAEGQRTNLLVNSQDFNTANWNLAGGNFTVTDSGIASPVAGVNFQKLTVTTTTNTTCSQTVTGSGSASGNTFSVYVKKGSGATECNRFNFYNTTTSQDLYRGTLNYDTGVFTPTGGTGTAVVETLPNGVYRLQLTNTAGVSNGDSLRVYCGFAGNSETAGKYLYAIGAQLEAGPTATSYIPTTTAAVTRNADVLTYPSAGNVLGTVGTCYAEVMFPNGASSTEPPRIITANSAAERNLLYVSSVAGGKGRLANYDGTGPASEVGYTVDIGGALNKVAASWGGSAATVAIGGLSNSGTFDGDFNVNELRIGNLCVAGYELNGNIANVCIWTRKLPDAVLKRISK